MRYFGNASSRSVREAMVRGEIGMIATPAEGRDPAALHIAPECDARRCIEPDHHAPTAFWCADNGCGPGRNGVIGAGYPGEAKWLAWLERLSPSAERCLFAVAPDVVGDAQATLDRSLPHLPIIRQLGYLAAFVGQDGLEHLTVPWDEFDVLFLGGSTSWKIGLSAYRLAREAQRRGKAVHMGRVNSGCRWDYAERIGCDSADGTFLAFGPDTNLSRLRGWLDQPASGQADLFDSIGESA